MPMKISKSALALISVASILAATEESTGNPPTSIAQETKKPKEEKKTKKELRVVGSATVVVTAERELIEQVHTSVSPEAMEALNAADVSEALIFLPGLTFTMNSRGEKIINVRGNDPRRVPVYLDGIPSYVPYDGQMDFGHFSTFDVEEIQVAKGFSSVILGPNTLGGAINLVTRRPSEKFEGHLSLGATDGNGRRATVNIGSAHDRFFIQAGGSLRNQGDFRMSSGFVPTNREDGGRRKNSDFRDSKLSAKIGFTPTDNSEFVIGYATQSGEKGTPVATYGSSQRYWRWPTWDKDNIYLISHVALGSKSYFKFRAYHDTYKNTLHTYTDGTYTQLASNRGVSKYDDFTNGAAIEFGTTSLKGHSIKAVAQMKVDAHRSIDDPANPVNFWRNLKDELGSIGIEDTITLADNLHLALGLALDSQKALETDEHEKVDTQTFLQGQAGVFWKITEKTQGYLTVAKKGKFPTLRDRYSMRWGSYLINPDLKSEESVNYDIGIKSGLFSWLTLEGAVFYSDITNLIERVRNVQPGLDQMQNVGKVRHQGIELSCHLKPALWLESGIYYTYLDRENLSDPDIRLRGVPKNRLTGYTRIQPSEFYFIFASVECQDNMWDSNTDRIAGYTAANLTAGIRPLNGMSFEAGFTNVLDRDYQQSVGHPLPGRTWFINGRYKF